VERIIDIILRQAPMLEQLCFHDYERNVLADQVLEKFALRVNGHFNERQAAAFRPWSWMEKNRKVLVVSPRGTDHANDMELIRRTGLSHIFDLYDLHE
jgi:hypothetical protein